MSISPVNVSSSTNPNYAKRNELMRKRNKAVAYALPSIGLAVAGGLPWAVGAKFAEKNKIVLSALAAIGVVGTVIAGYQEMKACDAIEDLDIKMLYNA